MMLDHDILGVLDVWVEYVGVCSWKVSKDLINVSGLRMIIGWSCWYVNVGSLMDHKIMVDDYGDKIM